MLHFLDGQLNGLDVDDRIKLSKAFTRQACAIIAVLFAGVALVLGVTVAAARQLLPSLGGQQTAVIVLTATISATTTAISSYVLRRRNGRRQANAPDATDDDDPAGSSAGSLPHETNEPCHRRQREPTAQAGTGDGAASNEGDLD